MMVQIVKRRKKGRPPKSDPARKPPHAPAPEPERSVRRSLRRRSSRYDFVDYDDFLDDEQLAGYGQREGEEEEEEDEEEMRRERKVKLVVKLSQGQKARGGHASGSGGVSGSEDEDENERKVAKKRRIGGGDGRDEDDEEVEERGGGVGADDEEEKGPAAGNLIPRGQHASPPPPGTSSRASSSSVPLPEKKTLELILDKLQKKDTYGVYADPVDPEELPDYHDVIEHPMDFSTVRKKLANGSYTKLDQVESDVFLICSNAMQYNAPDTIYHKQAKAIEELGKKKFLKLRIKFERSEKEHKKSEHEAKIQSECYDRDIKSEHKTKSNCPVKKQFKKPQSRSLQEPVGSDFSGGVTLASNGDVQSGSATKQVGLCENGHVDSSTFLAENTVEKAEEAYTGKGLPSKLGRRPFANDENHRATYCISQRPLARPASTLSTFEGEIRQLVAVGLPAEYSYARSLARFAATLGPTAWRVASQKIVQSLPAGCKFGRGWVGEYEPIPTPVQLSGNCLNKDLPHCTNFKKDGIPTKTAVSVKENAATPAPEGKQSPVHQSNLSTLVNTVRSSDTLTVIHQKQSPVCKDPAGPESKVIKQFELNSLPSPCQNPNTSPLVEKKPSNGSEMVASRSRGIISKNSNHLQPECSESATSRAREIVSRNVNPMPLMHFRQLNANRIMDGRLPNGKLPNDIPNCSKMTSQTNGYANKMPSASSFTPTQDQGLSDPVQLMRLLNENAQKQQNSSNHSGLNGLSIRAPVPATRKDSSGNIPAAAWISMGSGGLKQAPGSPNTQKSHLTPELSCNSMREHPHMVQARSEMPISAGIQFQAEKNSHPLRSFVPVPPSFTIPNEKQAHLRPMISSQLMTADLSRFQGQLHWHGITPHTQPRQKEETVPPDLNIGFQSPKSPAKQSSAVLRDSQQPDLALQL